MKTPERRTTLQELLLAIQDHCRSDAEVVAVLTHLMKSRRLTLRGAFGNRRLAIAAAR